MIQDSVNQMMGSLAGATNLYDYHINQNIASTKESLEANATAAKQLDSQIAFAEKQQQGLDKSSDKWKEMEALRTQSVADLEKQAKSTEELEQNLIKLSGYKGGIPKNAAQTTARTAGINNVTANNKLYMAQKMREYSLESAKAAAEAKEEQANNNAKTYLETNLGRIDPDSDLGKKLMNQMNKENK